MNNFKANYRERTIFKTKKEAKTQRHRINCYQLDLFESKQIVVIMIYWIHSLCE